MSDFCEATDWDSHERTSKLIAAMEREAARRQRRREIWHVVRLAVAIVALVAVSAFVGGEP